MGAPGMRGSRHFERWARGLGPQSSPPELAAGLAAGLMVGLTVGLTEDPGEPTQALEALTLADVVTWFRQHLLPRAVTRRKLSVQLWSHAAAKAAALPGGAFVDTPRVEALKAQWGYFPPQSVEWPGLAAGAPRG